MSFPEKPSFTVPLFSTILRQLVWPVLYHFFTPRLIPGQHDSLLVFCFIFPQEMAYQCPSFSSVFVCCSRFVVIGIIKIHWKGEGEEILRQEFVILAKTGNKQAVVLFLYSTLYYCNFCAPSLYKNKIAKRYFCSACECSNKVNMSNK